MRMHIELDDQLVAEVDDLAGPRGRSGFVRLAIERAVQQERRWRDLDAAAGATADTGHAWDADPAEWVRQQRRADVRRAG
ncbi:MAG TPA: type II toxin-antitoxin system VapB family antitoxin [Friedmanniella sp.]